MTELERIYRELEDLRTRVATLERRSIQSMPFGNQPVAMPATEIQNVEKFVFSLKDQTAKKDAMRKKGICPECDGEGEQGGQFCGGTWKCEACSGTGKAPVPVVQHLPSDDTEGGAL